MRIALDIGGTLTKVLIFLAVEEAELESRIAALPETDDDLKLQVRGGSLHFLHFGSCAEACASMRELLRLRASLALPVKKPRSRILLPARGGGGRARRYPSKIFVTGGGAFRERAQLEALGLPVVAVDEMKSLVDGVRVLLKNSLAFTLDNSNFGGDQGTERLSLRTTRFTPSSKEHAGGFLLVNIGSGVSVLDIGSKGRYERVGGSSLGGSTFLGLTCLLTGCRTYDEAIELASKGNSRPIDLSVGDIFGKKGMPLGLRETTLASSFGKMLTPSARKAARPEDLALSTLVMQVPSR